MNTTRQRRPGQFGLDLLQPVSCLSEQDACVLAQARDILLKLAAQPGAALTSPNTVREYLKTVYAGQPRELFSVILLSTRHHVIATEILFAGTLDGTSVYPREVVKCALRHNAAAVILAHNHPSGVSEPSQADELITARLKEALALVDIRVLDHLIVAGGQTFSFAERGLL